LNIKKLAESGLNIFAAIEIEKLPIKILDIFNAQNIKYTSDDILCIVGSGGQNFWEKLNHPLDETKHPIDKYTFEQIKKLDPNCKIIFPNQTLNIPLQRISRFLNISRPTILGIDIHKEFGLWFSFRGVFLTTKKISTNENEEFNSPCETCKTKDCISTCPANAISNSTLFKIDLCMDHQNLNNSSCENHCLARLACPYQNIHQYKPEQTLYHIKSRKLIYHK